MRWVKNMPLIDIYEEKWFRKVTAAREKWLRAIKSAESFEAFVRGVAAVTGLSESEVASSIPARNWKEFQANAEKYVDLFIKNIERAHAMRKWARNYVEAFRAH